MNKTLHYLFDPLCGWCYGASPALSALAGIAGLQLRLWPSGLFSGDGARVMDEAFATYAWSNDQRIERLTGQAFSARYRSNVLGNRQQMFDSGPATVALAAVALTEPARELAALKAIQQARYVEAQDITQTSTLVGILNALDLQPAAARLAQADADLMAANRTRTEQAQALQQRFGARGVPALILEYAGHSQLLHSSQLFSDPQAFAQQLASM